jgi:hypothetical protein
MSQLEKPPRASSSRKARVAERDAKFIEYLNKESTQERLSSLAPTKRIGFLINSFKEETGLVMPTTMAYRAWHKSRGAIKIPKGEFIKFPSDSSSEDNMPKDSPVTEEAIDAEVMKII